jgi:two-component system cell cycle sensor histidine kinase/response regulator CckA
MAKKPTYEELEQRVRELELEAEKHKGVEMALQKSEEKFSKLFQASPIYTCVTIVEDGRFLEVNDAFMKVTGYQREKVIGHTTTEVGLWANPEERINFVKLAKEQGRFRDQEVNFLKKNGEPLVMLWSAEKIELGGEDCFISALVDITELKKAQEELKESEEKFRRFFEDDLTGDYIATSDGIILECNPAFLQIFGYDNKAELVSENIPVLYPEPSEKAFILDELRAKGKLENYETIRKRKDGTLITVIENIVATFDEDRKLIERKGYIYDITERKRMEQELLKIEKLESLGMLAGGLAHDFNNILTTIIGNISLAKMDVDRGTSLYEFLEEAEKASQRATNLTQQLLTFAKGGAPVKETASLSEVLRESTSFSLRGSKVRADFVIPEGLWPVEIDVGQMNQVISNLVINADQAMPDGGVIQIQAENMSIGAGHGLPLEPGEYIRICIRDQGIGIPEKYLSKIFDPYFSTKHKGSGLGLTTVYSIVKKHDGHITVDSEVGVGTTFDIYLPASEKELAETKEVEEEAVKGQGRILVMDDEESIRDLAYQSLRRLGYEVELAADGKEAIEKYEKAGQSQNPFDAVILDLTIPGGMGGKECIRRLKEIDPGVKAIVASGYADDPVMANFGDYGFTLSVAKPFSIEKLGQGLHHLLTGS